MYLQQDEVMSELPEYAKMDPPPKHSREVLATDSYLRALKLISSKGHFSERKLAFFNQTEVACNNLRS